MLSRKTAKTLAEVFHAKFEGRERVDTLQGWKTFYRLGKDWLYDFLYEHDYDAWFLNSAKALRTSDKRALKEFIMRLHTGGDCCISNARLDMATKIETRPEALERSC